MVCIYCDGSTQVTNSRHQKRTNTVWRRRQCAACGAIFSSIEQPDFATTLTIRSGAHKLTPFSRDQLFVSIYESCKHRSKAVEDAEALCRTIIANILTKSTDSSIDRNDVVAITYQILRRFDDAAATIYKAFHPLTKYAPFKSFGAYSVGLLSEVLPVFYLRVTEAPFSSTVTTAFSVTSNFS